MKSAKIDWTIYISVIIIIISIAAIGINITGHATDDATVNITITSTASINFTVDFVNFTDGNVNAGAIGATLDTEGTVTNGTWGATSSGFTLENIGNVNVSLNMTSDKNASVFLGGTNPTFKYKITEDEAGACEKNNASSYIDLNISGLIVCYPFVFHNGIDEVSVDIELFVPSDSNTGEQTATITAVATSI